MTDLTVMPPGKALARRRNNNSSTAAKLIGAGLVLIQDQLSNDVVQHFVDADICSKYQQHWPHLWQHSIHSEYVEKAKSFYRHFALPRAIRIEHAADFLRQLRKPHPQDAITHEQASAMLHALFASITGKLRLDEAAMVKLTECVNIFGPGNNTLGEVLNLWKPVPMHPAVLALAIKQMQAIRTFEPSQAELREALDKVATECVRLENKANDWLDQLKQSDLLMFKTDPDGWRAAHLAATQPDNEAFLVIEHDQGDGEYEAAIEALYEATFDDWGDRRDAIAAEAPKQIAACKAKPQKRTKKLKQREDTSDE